MINKLKYFLFWLEIEVKSWYVANVTLTKIKLQDKFTRSEKGYCNNDSFGADEYIARVISGILKEYVINLDKECEADLPYPGIIPAIIERANIEKQRKMVLKIIEGFDDYLEFFYIKYSDLDFKIVKKEQARVTKSLNKSFELLNKNFSNLWL